MARFNFLQRATVWGALLSAAIATDTQAQLLVDGIPNIDDSRLHAWYDAADFLGFDGVAETPLWPNRQGIEDRSIWSGFRAAAESAIEVSSINNNTMPAVQFYDSVAWSDAALFGLVEDGFTVMVVAKVDDPAFAYFFTGNQGGGGAEANANFSAEEPDTWTMKGNDGVRISTGPVVADQLQYHTFVYGEDEVGSHYIDGELVGSGEIGFASLDGFVLGGRQNGGQRASVTFAEVLVYDAALEDPDRQILENYLQNKYFATSLAGDFDADGALSAGDIDLLSAAVRAGETDLVYDVNSDGVVSAADRGFWLSSLKKVYIGDANLDGEFNTSDFVAAFQFGQYEDGVAGNSTWASGDWNGDAEFDSSDFVEAFQEGGYEQGPRAAVSAVPEPSAMCLFALGGLTLLRRRKA